MSFYLSEKKNVFKLIGPIERIKKKKIIIRYVFEKKAELRLNRIYYIIIYQPTRAVAYRLW